MTATATQRAKIAFLTLAWYDAMDADTEAQAAAGATEAARLKADLYISAQDGLEAAITKLRADALAELDHRTAIAKEKAAAAQATANARQAAKDAKDAAEREVEQAPVLESPGAGVTPMT